MNENLKAVVDYAFTDNATQMRDALYNEINDKIFGALEQRKQELARSLISPEHQEVEAEEQEVVQEPEEQTEE